MSLMQIRVRDITEDARNIRKTAASEKAQAELEDA